MDKNLELYYEEHIQIAALVSMGGYDVVIEEAGILYTKRLIEKLVKYSKTCETKYQWFINRFIDELKVSVVNKDANWLAHTESIIELPKDSSYYLPYMDWPMMLTSIKIHFDKNFEAKHIAYQAEILMSTILYLRGERSTEDRDMFIKDITRLHPRTIDHQQIQYSLAAKKPRSSKLSLNNLVTEIIVKQPHLSTNSIIDKIKVTIENIESDYYAFSFDEEKNYFLNNSHLYKSNEEEDKRGVKLSSIKQYISKAKTKIKKNIK